MTIKELLDIGARQIEHISDIAKKEARILLASHLNKDQVWLLTHENDEVCEKAYLKLIKRRAQNEPIEYITNSANFYSRDFYVDKRVLIPRPETEILIDEVVSTCKGLKRPLIVEIGVGSGIISIMLAKLLPHAQITAVDISTEALSVAKINAKKFGVEEKIEFLHSDLLDNYRGGNFDVLVSNPPYIATDETLHVGLSYEPDLALFGGTSGDEILQKIIDIFTSRNIKWLVCEMGYDQRDKITRYLNFFDLEARFYRDLAGLDRGFIVKKGN